MATENTDTGFQNGTDCPAAACACGGNCSCGKSDKLQAREACPVYCNQICPTELKIPAGYDRMKVTNDSPTQKLLITIGNGKETKLGCLQSYEFNSKENKVSSTLEYGPEICIRTNKEEDSKVNGFDPNDYSFTLDGCYPGTPGGIAAKKNIESQL